jgi:hypothetical protein
VRSELPQDIASFPNHLKTVDIQGPQSEKDLLTLSHLFARMASLPTPRPAPPTACLGSVCWLTPHGKKKWHHKASLLASGGGTDLVIDSWLEFHQPQPLHRWPPPLRILSTGFDLTLGRGSCSTRPASPPRILSTGLDLTLGKGVRRISIATGKPLTGLLLGLGLPLYSHRLIAWLE